MVGAHPPSPPPPNFRHIHVHRLNVVWAGPLPPARCRQGNRRYPGQHLPHDPGPLRMALNPHTAQPCCGQKHSSLLASGRQTEWGGGVEWGGGDKQGCRKPAGYRPLGSTRNVVRCAGAPDCGVAHYSCAEGRDRQKPHQVATVVGPAGRIWG